MEANVRKPSCGGDAPNVQSGVTHIMYGVEFLTTGSKWWPSITWMRYADCWLLFCNWVKDMNSVIWNLEYESSYDGNIWSSGLCDLGVPMEFAVWPGHVSPPGFVTWVSFASRGGLSCDLKADGKLGESHDAVVYAPQLDIRASTIEPPGPIEPKWRHLSNNDSSSHTLWYNLRVLSRYMK